MMKTAAITWCIAVFYPLTGLSKGDATKGGELYKACIECHGEKGQGVVDKQGPMLAGQFDWYLLEQLQNFKSKKRKNPEMDPTIKNLSTKDFQDLAAYISRLKPGQ